MLNALDALEAEKGISKEIVIDALEAALVSAYKRHYGQAQNVEVEFDQKKGKIHVYAVKEVTEEVMDSQLEVSLKDALLINPAYEIGDTIRFEVTPKILDGSLRKRLNKLFYSVYVKQKERLFITNSVLMKKTSCKESSNARINVIFMSILVKLRQFFLNKIKCQMNFINHMIESKFMFPE